jgi:hypothetical protein
LDGLTIRVTGLAVSDDGLIFGTTSWDGVLRSTDNGVTWDILKNGLDITWLEDIIYNPKNRHLFVLDERRGVFMSTNLGESWELQNSGLPDNIQYVSLTSNPNTGQMFVTTSNGIYRSTDQAIYVEEPEEIPTAYSLSQNYPNPFNPTTKIQYSLPEESRVQLPVYNSLGQEVMQLVNETQSAGKYIVDFNAQNLPSGIYFYRLQTNKFVDTKKMLLVK